MIRYDTVANEAVVATTIIHPIEMIGAIAII